MNMHSVNEGCTVVAHIRNIDLTLTFMCHECSLKVFGTVAEKYKLPMVAGGFLSYAGRFLSYSKI